MICVLSNGNTLKGLHQSEGSQNEVHEPFSSESTRWVVKCRFLGPWPELLNQSLLEWVQEICVSNTPVIPVQLKVWDPLVCTVPIC